MDDHTCTHIFIVLKAFFLTWIIYCRTVIQVFVLKSQGSNEYIFFNFKMHFISKQRIMKQKYIPIYLKSSQKLTIHKRLSEGEHRIYSCAPFSHLRNGPENMLGILLSSKISWDAD